MSTEQLVVAVNGELKNTVETLGGKANSLNQLVSAGFTVPTAWCVTIPAYQFFMRENQLADQNTVTDTDVQNKIMQADIPAILKTSILDAYQSLGDGSHVAIRSSAKSEDSAASSFAGQFDTFLHVKGEDEVLSKVKACWSSLWAERARSYQDKNQALDQFDDDGGIAVVIQQMIDADAAGVLFTNDPLGQFEDAMVIDGCWGLGEGVVSGQVVTDSFTVAKKNGAILHRDVREKPVYSGRNADGVVTILNTDEKKQRQSCLTDEQITHLAEQAKKIRAWYGCELDIEWAYKDGQLWLLQARPITVATLASVEKIYADPWETDETVKENCMFSRMDTGEIVTGLMTPLGISFCHFYQQHIHGPAIKCMGMSEIGDWHTFMGYIQGYVYLNISSAAKDLTQCPPTHDPMIFTKRYATDEVDFTHYKNPYGDGYSGFKFFKTSLHWIKTQFTLAMQAKGIVKDMVELRERETKRFLALDLQAMTLPELNAELTRIDGYFLDACSAYMPFFLQSFAMYDALAEACEEWLSGKGDQLQNRVKASMNNLRTIEVTKGIVDLVDVVKRTPALVEIFEKNTATDLLSILPEDNDGKHFWQNHFNRFLENFGSRGRQEFELSIPRWNDDPTYLLQVMKMYLKNEVDLEGRLAETGKKRDNDTEELLKDLPLKARMKIKFLINTYGVMAERREETRPTFIAETWFYRKIICEVLRRLEQDGVVKQDELAYIDFNKFRDYVAGRASASEAFDKAMIERNRHQHLINMHADEPPLALIGGYTPTRKRKAVSDGDDNTLSGLAASPGTIVARARVITDLPTQAEQFQQGEILVAKFTDASWTPLFILASGIVADIGSTLSHSSIVSREFGIPAVVNVGDGTQKIQTGDLIFLDGDNGIVSIQERRESVH